MEFDVPFPLPPEMKVDENGKELDVEKLNELYKEFNKGKNDILSLDPNGEKFGAVVLAAGWRPYLPAEGELAHLGMGPLPMWSPTTSLKKLLPRAKSSARRTAKKPNPLYLFRARVREMTRILPTPVP